jgi:hypothetical protein
LEGEQQLPPAVLEHDSALAKSTKSKINTFVLLMKIHHLPGHESAALVVKDVGRALVTDKTAKEEARAKENFIVWLDD